MQMNKFKNSVITAAALGSLALIGSMMNSHSAALQGAGGGPTVTIDPTQLPLPVKLSVTPSFTLSGNSAANPLLVRNVDDPARHAFLFVPTSPGSAGGESGFATAAVPANTRYVVEHYSGACAVDNVGAMTNLFLQILRPGVPPEREDYATPHLVDTGGTINGHAVNLWAASGNTRLYAEAGEFIYVQAQANTNATGAGIRSCSGLSVSGYSVSLP